ncbi:MAG TPA: hypothetical protein VJ946_09595, partial [Bacteroidales bacterium]|nr:hypothetical protein [Bacteroidales bacterium]
RLVSTLIGALLSLSVIRLLWTQWQYKKLPVLLASALEKNTGYFKVILDEYKKSVFDDNLQYRIARREAHQADNALALAWQDVLSEPAKYRKFHHQAYRLTWLNHSLLSFISAFGAQRIQSGQVEPELLALGSEILNALGGSHLNDEIRTRELDIIIGRVNDFLQSELAAPSRQRFILLYNIALNARQLAGDLTKELAIDG